jgi:D-sedoheptulose 7-phosphate isomerase
MNFVASRIKESIDVKKLILEDEKLQMKINQAASKIIEAFVQGKKVLFCGNGGSAADAQHLAAELMGKLYLDREPLLAISLTTNTSSLTAIANDISYDEVFYRQLKALGNKGDILLSLSTSGKSKSIIKAMQYAEESGIYNIALSGREGGDMKEHAALLINVPSNITARIQESQILIGHIICEIVEKELFIKNSIY